MPTLTLTVQVPWSKGTTTLPKMDRDIHRAAMAAGRTLLVQALGLWEQDLLPFAGARQRRVRRYLLTRLGPVRFFRWKTRKDGRYSFPLDRAMRLHPWQGCSGWVWERACRLCTDHPFRQAARLLSDLVGTPLDHRRLWGARSMFVAPDEGELVRGGLRKGQVTELSRGRIQHPLGHFHVRRRLRTDEHPVGDGSEEPVARGTEDRPRRAHPFVRPAFGLPPGSAVLDHP